MFFLLTNLFIKDKDDIENPRVRQAYGMLCGTVGIMLNLLLFAGKFLAGTISHSISITADAFNNLSDAGASVVTLAGFKMAGAKPDVDHPYGHGRIEYISGLIVSGAIIVMAFELIKSSIDKIITPAPVEFSILSVAILFVYGILQLQDWKETGFRGDARYGNGQPERYLRYDCCFDWYCDRRTDRASH